jgi:hypothetical protein
MASIRAAAAINETLLSFARIFKKPQRLRGSAEAIRQRGQPSAKGHSLRTSLIIKPLRPFYGGDRISRTQTLFQLRELRASSSVHE